MEFFKTRASSALVVKRKDYIAYKGSNYKIPKDIIPQDLNLQACLEIVKLQSDKDTGKSKRTAKAVKATKTTKTTAKATAKTSKTK